MEVYLSRWKNRAYSIQQFVSLIDNFKIFKLLYMGLHLYFCSGGPAKFRDGGAPGNPFHPVSDCEFQPVLFTMRAS